jgi:nucleoside-diphosphate-sugar epimerase
MECLESSFALNKARVRSRKAPQSEMRILIIGGTRFIGPRVAEQLLTGGHEVTLFHRGQTEGDLPGAVNHIYGDRRDLPSFKSQFKSLAPDVVVDMVCYNEREASSLMRTFKGVAGRVAVASSMDVYRAYGGLLGLEVDPPEPIPSMRSRRYALADSLIERMRKARMIWRSTTTRFQSSKP